MAEGGRQMADGKRQRGEGVPEGWREVRLGDITELVTSGSRGWAQFYSDEGDLFIRITNLDRSNIYLDFSELKYVKLPKSIEGERTKIKRNDILISITADLGIVGYINDELEKNAYVNQHISLVRLKENSCSKFVAYYLASPLGDIQFQKSNDAGAKKGLNLESVRNVHLLLPPLPEQQKIASILSTWDEAIATLTNLLAAKRQQKRGLAEALLTGKKRLPGFAGEWEEKKLGEVFYLLIGGTPSRKEATFWDVDRTTENVWLSIADLKEKYASDSKEYISDLGAKKSNVKRIPANTVVMSFKLTLGRAAITTRPLYTNEAICAFIPMQENVVDTEYFYQSIALMDFTDGVDIAVKGATMNKEKLTNFSFSLPPFREQQAIASILSTLDSEIASLEALKAKVQEQKRGLMDELLTGRVRVKVEG